ncbi:MAG: hypothetical protein HY093_04905, partial [Candidatus Liptonbacteria bacterium]|nr:hypothetical protein [Candidatus Liptonbacteria bacterium]
MALKRLIFPSFLVIAIIFSIIPAKAVITLEAEPLSSSIQEPVSTTATSSIISTTPATTPATHKIDLAKISADLQAIQSLKSSGSPSVLVSKLETDFNQVKSDLTAIKSDLSAKNLSSKILERLDNFSQSYTSRIQKIIDALKSAAAAESLILEFTQIPEISKKIYNPHPFRVIESPGTINKVPVSEFPKTNLPAPSDALKKLINSTTLKNVAGLLKVTSSSPSLSTAPNPAPTTETVASVNSSPTPADLAETEEIKFTQNIKNLATSLNSDPLTIFNYVSNNLDFIPYFGSKKGADATLVEKAGNDFDQASLLIALLRVGDQNSQNKTPARYKQATVKLDLGRVMDLLGVEDPVVAATVLEKTDIPYVLYVDQNQTPLFFVVELTYVEAYVDYDYTRGVIQGTG